MSILLDPSFPLAVIAILLVATIALRTPERLGPMLRQAGTQAKALVASVPFGLFIAACLAQILPSAAIATVLGHDSGVIGIVIAWALGGFIPGGPMVAYPIALGLIHLGAGEAQMITLLTAWSLFAVHRILTYELGLMGRSFVVLRLLACAPLPLMAGGAVLLWRAAIG